MKKETRPERINFRVTKEERAELERCAKKMKMKLGAFARMAALDLAKVNR